MLSDGLTLAAGAGMGIQMLDDARRGTDFPAGTQGDLWELTEQAGQFGPGIYEFFDGLWVLRNPAYSALSYDISGTVLGRPDSAAKVLYIVAARTFYIQAAAAGAVAYAMQAPDVEQDFSIIIQRGQQVIPVGSVRFSPGVEQGVFFPSSNDPIRVQRSDALLIFAPDIVDQVIADISFTLCGYLAV